LRLRFERARKTFQGPVVLAGALLGLGLSVGTLVLFRYGVAGVLQIGNINLMYLLWPFSIIAVFARDDANLGALLVFIAIVLNCVMYGALAFFLLKLVGRVADPSRRF
jgi:hypothetical protein